MELRDVKNIEKVSVLKSPDAVALYGNAAINGVIIVQTKSIKQDSILKNTNDKKQLIHSQTSIAASFKIFPNPVSSGTNLNIEWNQTEEGYYSLQLLNQSGQSVHQKEIWIDAEARVLQIDIPFVAAGSYFLALTNKKSGKRLTEKIIVQ
jgi:TonB-dependent SusC/RagA subfamily outer membrane receptor